MSIITIIRGLLIIDEARAKYFNLEFNGRIEADEVETAVREYAEENNAMIATKIETLVFDDEYTGEDEDDDT